MLPSRPLARLLLHLVRAPLVLLTWLHTRATPTALRDFEPLLARAWRGQQRMAAWTA